VVVNLRKADIDLSNLKNSLKAFEEALNPQNLLERDGSIQRFEFTFEMSWKTLAKVLQADQPLADNSVKGILREGARQHFIGDVEKWFEFQAARDKTSHTYDPVVAAEVFAIAKELPPYVHSLIQKLELHLKV
jgi:nucleotidyltransferase substrate binding protein (TIGR01987 family)